MKHDLEGNCTLKVHHKQCSMDYKLELIVKTNILANIIFKPVIIFFISFNLRGFVVARLWWSSFLDYS